MKITKAMLQKIRDLDLEPIETMVDGKLLFIRRKVLFVDGKFSKGNYFSYAAEIIEDLLIDEVGVTEYVKKSVIDGVAIEAKVESILDEEDNAEIKISLNGQDFDFKWIKYSGTLDVATCNGKDLLEEQYIELVNSLEELGLLKVEDYLKQEGIWKNLI